MYHHTHKLTLMDVSELDEKAKDLNVRVISSAVGVAIYLDSEDEDEARVILKRSPAIFVENDGGKLVAEKDSDGDPAWLVEMFDKSTGTHQSAGWMCVGFLFSRSPEAAIRFARKEDAQAMAEALVSRRVVSLPNDHWLEATQHVCC